MRRRAANKLWRATCRAAKIEDLTFHDLRGELASSMAEAGVPVHHVMEALDHSSITTTKAYLRSRTTSLGEAYEKLEQARVLAFQARRPKAV